MTDLGDKPWLVGENNPYSRHQKYSLFPDPPLASGGRLQRILGLTREEYLANFHRWNLIVGAGWSKRAAAWAAFGVAVVSGDAPVIMCGRKVTEAFGFDYAAQTVYADRFVCIPHPSGLNRAWNDPKTADVVRVMVHEVVARWRARRAA